MADKETEIEEIEALLEPVGWGLPEPGSVFDRTGFAFNRESYFR